MADTHFAAVRDGVVIGTRSSASRHVGGAGKFGPYTHAAAAHGQTTGWGVWSWHGTLANAQHAARYITSHSSHTSAESVDVVVTPKRLTIGDVYAPAEGDAQKAVR